MTGPFETQAQADAQRLRDQLAEVSTAVRAAYRDTARLIRLLTVIGAPWSTSELLDRTLTTLSDAYSADVTCTLRAMDGRLTVTNSCGLPEDDPAHSIGWELGGTAAHVLESGIATISGLIEPADVPPSLRGLNIRSAVWVPLDSRNELLVLYRSSPEPFIPADLQILDSVVSRLQLAIEARERSAALERLAQSSHRLAQHLDLPALLDEAAELLRPMIQADRAIALVIRDGQAERCTCSGEAHWLPDDWPRPVTELPGWDVVRDGRPYRDVGPHAHLSRRTDIPGRLPRSLLCVPVMRDGAPVALLYGARVAPRLFGSDAVETAGLFANYLAAAMINAELYQALQQSETSLRLITDSISDMIAVVDRTGVFVYASPSHERELGHDPGELIGERVTDLAYPADRARLRTALADVTAPSKVEYRVRSGAGYWVWVETALRPAPWRDSTIVLSSRVIDERKRLEDELLARATHDPLTGLANRPLARQRLEEALERDEPSHVGLLFCDLDRFKAVNDRLGHEAGDELLQEVSARLRPCLRPTDVVARFGGDEFVFVLDGVNSLTDVTEIGRRVLRALAEPFTLRGERFDVSASIGGVLGVRGESSASAMLRDADAAMYAAKDKGLGLVEVFDEDASHRSLDRLGLRSELQHALERGQLSVHYQPIFALKSRAVVGFEALLRWTHPERGPIPPDVFIPLAEETGAILPIGDWVLDRACRQLAAWQRLPGRDRLSINVNLSATQLRQPHLAAHTIAIINAAGLDPADVWLEVTEHSYVYDDVTEYATTLRRAGVHFALDDFGMSYSNLSYLKRFPIECLKIDRSFVDGLGTRETDLGIVRAVLAIAETLGLAVVAEGIETEAQRDWLVRLGCQHGQGYLLSRPVPAEEATALLVDPAHPAVTRLRLVDRQAG